MSINVQGRILEKGQPCASLKVEAYDEHPVADALLGGALTESNGSFVLNLDQRQFRGDTALLLVVSRQVGSEYQELLSLRPRVVSGNELNLGDVDVAE